MNDTLIAQIQRFTLDARHSLEQEASEQLEGLYGWMPDGSFAKANLYPALNQLEEARETRRKLEGYAIAEKEAGFSAGVVRQKLIRETAFTWLNRVVALRMMEERRLVKSAVSRLMESNAYLFWLADEIDPNARKLHDLGETPVNAMGEGPRHVAYRRFLLWQLGVLARDISVLFDPNTLASHLFPRPNVFKLIIEAMNVEMLIEAWRPGNEETIGWIYQAFISEEKDAVFAGFQKGKKVTPEQIAPATQVFTPRWVIRFLIENSVGRLWVEMHPDSYLKNSLAYLVPIDEKSERPLKPAREITFLDPATGSMHFGLVAFNLFCEMYREELENTGKPGWPEKPSVETLDDIPASIVFHNLHGIDIDLRAIQLSALILFLRARSLNPRCPFTDKNLACANVEQITGGRLDDFIRQARFSHPIYERILRGMAARLKDSDCLGSLLRPEIDLERLIAEERTKAEKDKQFLLSFPGVTKEQFQTKEGIEKFFEVLSEQISQHLDEFVQESRADGNGVSHFAAEASKGLRFLRLVQQRYDVVATNPPYMSRRNQSALVADFLDSFYTDSKSDLYASFIERCVELTKDAGLTAMITQQSFMFISSYEKFRINLRKAIAIETMAHLGPKAFQMVTGEKVNTTTFVFRKEPDEKRRDENEGIYFRLVRERDAEAKRTTFQSALAALRSGQSHPLFFRYRQRRFDAVPEKPWVYWMPDSFHNLFFRFKLLRDIAPVVHGTTTYDTQRFLRYWWECGTSRLCRYAGSWAGFVKSQCPYVPYMKGGSSKPWFGNQEFVLRLFSQGNELKEFLSTKRDKIRGINYLFRRGITWSLVSSRPFAARFSPDGFIFDVAGVTCFPPDSLIETTLAVLNSRPAVFILSALNPTINFPVGTIQRLPVLEERSDQIASIVNECIELLRQEGEESEITYDFVRPLQCLDKYAVRRETLSDRGKKVDFEVCRLYGLTESDLAAFDCEVATAFGSAEEETDIDIPIESEPEPSPGSPSIEDWAQTWLSYAIGIVIGRFEVGVPAGLGCGEFTPEVVSVLKTIVASDGILINGSRQPLDVANRVCQALETMLGLEEARLRVGMALGEGDALELLHGWFDRFTGQTETSFWRYHFQLYRKRPVYWPLQSPKRKFTVWIFHELFTRDTLFHIRNDIVEPRLRLAERQIADLRVKAEADKRARKELDHLFDFRDDLNDFSKRLQEIADRGYIPHIDDGVLLNAAPLHEILPSWPETKKAWEELEKGKYDWAQQAMEYWPERVKEKCKTNKSFAIAHGLEELYEEPKNKKPPRKGKGR